MITRQDLEIKNPWWKDGKHSVPELGLPKRDLYSVLADNLEHTLMLNIVGLRRVGKSTILKQLIGHLLNQKIKPNNICYFLFEFVFYFRIEMSLNNLKFHLIFVNLNSTKNYMVEILRN